MPLRKLGLFGAIRTFVFNLHFIGFLFRLGSGADLDHLAIVFVHFKGRCVSRILSRGVIHKCDVSNSVSVISYLCVNHYSVGDRIICW